MELQMQFFEQADLADLFQEMDAINSAAGVMESDVETAASQRRYEEIICKHRNEGLGNQ